MSDSLGKVAKLPTIRRLPVYLHLLRGLQGGGTERVSSTYIAEQLKLDAVQVRKDLSSTGIVGKPRVGFEVTGLIDAIESFLGWNNTTEAILIGVGNLGSALLGYAGFMRHNLSVVAAFDADPQKAGTEIAGKPVFPMEKLANLVHRLHIRICILTVPAQQAQGVVNLLLAAGITAIWNFTPVALHVPAGVIVQNEDLAGGLAVLSRRVRDAETAHPPRADESAEGGDDAHH